MRALLSTKWPIGCRLRCRSLADLSKEPKSTWDLYGPEAKEPGTFAYNCLMARRMAERGVRFTQVYKRGWDMHDNVTGILPIICQETDRGCYALVTDLKQRGLLDDTLVIWASSALCALYRHEPARMVPSAFVVAACNRSRRRSCAAWTCRRWRSR